MQIVSAVIQGILLGGLYALFAAGLSFMFGVMRLVNLAHGALAILAAYGAVWLVQSGIFNPLTAAIVVVPVMAALGYIAQRFVLQRTLSESPLPSVLVTFGIAIVISNVLLVTMSANDQGLNAGPIETASITFGEITIGVFPLIVLGFSILVLGGLSLMMARTQFGRLVRAVSDDEPTVGLMGANPKHIYAIAAAIAFGLVAFAGIGYGIQTTFKPTSGDILLIYAFEAVIIGGLGSLWGTLIGSIILGVVQTVSATFDTSLFQLSGHLVFLIFLVFLPNGIIRRKVRT